MHKLLKVWKITICLCSFLNMGKSFVLPTIQCRWGWKLKTDWTPHDNSYVIFKESKFTSVVVDVSDPMTPSHSKYSCPSLCHLCWLHLDSWLQFPWIICGLQWYMACHQSACVFTFPPIVAYVSNSSTEQPFSHSVYAAKAQKNESITLNTFRPDGSTYLLFTHVSFVQCHHHLENKCN